MTNATALTAEQARAILAQARDDVGAIVQGVHYDTLRIEHATLRQIVGEADMAAFMVEKTSHSALLDRSKLEQSAGVSFDTVQQEMNDEQARQKQVDRLAVLSRGTGPWPAR